MCMCTQQSSEGLINRQMSMLKPSLAVLLGPWQLNAAVCFTTSQVVEGYEHPRQYLYRTKGSLSCASSCQWLLAIGLDRYSWDAVQQSLPFTNFFRVRRAMLCRSFSSFLHCHMLQSSFWCLLVQSLAYSNFNTSCILLYKDSASLLTSSAAGMPCILNTTTHM